MLSKFFLLYSYMNMLDFVCFTLLRFEGMGGAVWWPVVASGGFGDGDDLTS